MAGAATSSTDADVVAVDYTPATLDCNDVDDWAASQFTYDVDGSQSTLVAATGLACSGSILSVTFPDFTVQQTAGADVVRYVESSTASERVTTGGGTEADTNDSSAISDGTDPVVLGVTLSHDGDGNQVWDGVGDVLTVQLSEPATLASAVLDNDGYEASEEPNLEALLGTQVAFGSGTVAKVLGAASTIGSTSSTWTLTVENTALDEGVAVGDATLGSSNADVEDGNSNTQAAGANVTVQAGNWPVCNTTVGDTTVTSRCISAFSTSADGDLTATARDGQDLDLNVFDTGLLQVQVIDADAQGDQYELIGSDHLLTTSDTVTIELNVGTLDPTVLIGTADLTSYSVTTGPPNTVTIVGQPQAASFTWAINCFVGSCGDDTTAATVDYAGTLTYAIDALSQAPPADRAAMDGTWIMTDAQAFGAPLWNPGTGTFDIEVAAPHFESDGATLNTGFFKAFLPVGLFGPNYFNVDPQQATYSAQAGGSGADVSSTIVTSGQTVTGVQLDVTGFGYSSPTIKLSASPQPQQNPNPNPSPNPQPVAAPPPPPPPAFDDPIADTVSPGDEVSTDVTGEGATEDRPTQTAITSPVEGEVVIEQRTSTTTELPSGQTALDIQVDIEAPPATPDDPLVLDFEIDASLLTDVDVDRLVVYRNGEPVPACISATRAVPDPCLATTQSQDDGDLTVTVRTSRASSWNFGVVEAACPEALVPSGTFDDVPEGASHAQGIDCAAWWGIIAGRGSTFAPGEPLTRGQAASVIARIIDAADAALPAAGDRFDDVTGDHADAIERLAAAGILHGTGDRTFAPNATLTRAHMAKLLVEAYEYASRETLPDAPDAFTDDDVALEAWIDRAAAAGLVQGRTGDAFAPNDPVTRAQVGSFAVYLLEALVDGGHADPPVR